MSVSMVWVTIGEAPMPEVSIMPIATNTGVGGVVRGNDVAGGNDRGTVDAQG